jgi:hypothetical protein
MFAGTHYLFQYLRWTAHGINADGDPASAVPWRANLSGNVRHFFRMPAPFAHALRECRFNRQPKPAFQVSNPPVDALHHRWSRSPYPLSG